MLRLTAEDLARQLGASSVDCAARVRRLEAAGYIGGYTIIRSHPDPVCCLVSAVITVVPDPLRSGYDLQQSLNFIPEVLTAEILDEDNSLLLRVRVVDEARLDEITAALRIQAAALADHAAVTTTILSRTQPSCRSHHERTWRDDQSAR